MTTPAALPPGLSLFPSDGCIFFFVGRFGISVLSGFPDNHPLWQKNVSKLTRLSHVKQEKQFLQKQIKALTGTSKTGAGMFDFCGP